MKTSKMGHLGKLFRIEINHFEKEPLRKSQIAQIENRSFRRRVTSEKGLLQKSVTSGDQFYVWRRARFPKRVTVCSKIGHFANWSPRNRSLRNASLRKWVNSKMEHIGKWVNCEVTHFRSNRFRSGQSPKWTIFEMARLLRTFSKSHS